MLVTEQEQPMLDAALHRRSKRGSIFSHVTGQAKRASCHDSLQVAETKRLRPAALARAAVLIAERKEVTAKLQAAADAARADRVQAVLQLKADTEVRFAVTLSIWYMPSV